MSLLRKFSSLRSNSIWVRARTGKSRIQQFLEALEIRFGPGKVGIGDYYDLHLFDPQLFTRSERLRVAGWRKQIEIDKALNKSEWRGFANDKFIFTQILERASIPVIPINAIYCEGGRSAAGVTTLINAQQLVQFLTHDAKYPIFAKPSNSCSGHYAMRIEGFEVSTMTLRLSSGDSMSFEEFHQTIVREDPLGHLFQPCLVSHSKIRTIVGNKASTIRLVIHIREGNAEAISGMWRLPVGNVMNDNFGMGSQGNMAAYPEIDSGKVSFAIRGVGREMTHETVHPDTGVSFKDFEIPFWHEARALALKASALFPGLSLQHWDLAVCDNGVMAMELNVNGGLAIRQMAQGKGILDGRF